MSGYIHSGVAGKMDKIRNANPGSILVTDKFGNAVESDITTEILENSMQDLFNRVGALKPSVGNLSALSTNDKSSLVGAINEIIAYLQRQNPLRSCSTILTI